MGQVVNGHFLSREEILAVKDIVVEDVYVEPWGGSVHVRSLLGRERGRLEVTLLERKGNNTNENMAQLKARLTVLSVVDDEGKRVFSDRDVDALNDKNAQALDIIASVAMRLSGISKQDAAELTKEQQSGDEATIA